jgi:hypothetical protein
LFALLKPLELVVRNISEVTVDLASTAVELVYPFQELLIYFCKYDTPFLPPFKNLIDKLPTSYDNQLK